MTHAITNYSMLPGIRWARGPFLDLDSAGDEDWNAYRLTARDGRTATLHRMHSYMPGRANYGGLFRFRADEQMVDVEVEPVHATLDNVDLSLHRDVVDRLDALLVTPELVLGRSRFGLGWGTKAEHAQQQGTSTIYTCEGPLVTTAFEYRHAFWGRLHLRAWAGSACVETLFELWYDDHDENGAEPLRLDSVFLTAGHELATQAQIMHGYTSWQDPKTGLWHIAIPMAEDPRYREATAQPKTKIAVFDGYILCGDRESTEEERLAHRVGGRHLVLERERSGRILFEAAKWDGQTVFEEPWMEGLDGGRVSDGGSRFDAPEFGPREDPSATGDDRVFGATTASWLDAKNTPEIAFSCVHDALHQYTMRARFPLRTDTREPLKFIPGVSQPEDNTLYEVWPDGRRRHSLTTVNRSNSSHYAAKDRYGNLRAYALQNEDEEHALTTIAETFEYTGIDALRYLAKDTVERELHYVRRWYPRMPHARAIGRVLRNYVGLYAVTADERILDAIREFYGTAVYPDWQPRHYPDAWFKPVHIMRGGVVAGWGEAKPVWATVAAKRHCPEVVDDFMLDVAKACAITCVRLIQRREDGQWGCPYWVENYNWETEPVAIPNHLLSTMWAWETVSGVQGGLLLGAFEGDDLAHAQDIMRTWPTPRSAHEASRLIYPVR